MWKVAQEQANKNIMISPSLMPIGRHPGCGCASDNYNCWLLYQMLLAELDDHNSYITLSHWVWKVAQEQTNENIMISPSLMPIGRHPGCGCVTDNYNCWLLYQMLLAELDDHNSYITQWPRVLNVAQNRAINASLYPGPWCIRAYGCGCVFGRLFPATVSNVAH